MLPSLPPWSLVTVAAGPGLLPPPGPSRGRRVLRVVASGPPWTMLALLSLTYPSPSYIVKYGGPVKQPYVIEKSCVVD